MPDSNSDTALPVSLSKFTVDHVRALEPKQERDLEDQRRVILYYGYQIDVLALTLDGEGRSENIAGRAAIAHTVATRSRERGISIADACLQKLQYSCWWPAGGKDNYLRQMRLAEWAVGRSGEIPQPAIRVKFRESQFIAAAVMQGQILDPTDGATHYMTTALWHGNPPSWARTAQVSAVLGNHVFFKGVK